MTAATTEPTETAPTPAEPLLQVTDLRTHFETPGGIVRAVDGVTFSLERGRTLGIVGESGSGKTVLSRSIMGLHPKRGTILSGSVRFDGTEIIGLSAKEMRNFWGARLAMIFQDPMTSLNPVMKIGKQITESIRQHLDVDRKYADELAENLLRSVRIPEPEQRLKEYPHQLSGGMRQRVCIAVALACGPALLFADEPTTALDVTVQAQVLDLMAAQQRERFMAVVLITHDLGVVAGRADDIAVMYAGRIVEKAPTSVLFSGMKMPYTEALLSSIPRLEHASHTRLATIPGRPPNLVSPPQGCKFAPRCAYVQDRCLEEEPPLRPGTEPGHEFRCWFPVGTPEGSEALARNRAAASATTPGVLPGALGGTA
ncbi:MAG: ABC transporter ATP-binding protein [Actinomycetota bacterium]